MIDFILGAVLGALAVLALYHFRGTDPAKALTTLSSIEQRIKAMIADALNDLKTAVEASIAKAVSDALTAVPPVDTAAVAAAQEATDEQAVRDFTAANFPAA